MIVARSVDCTLYFAGMKFSMTGTSIFVPSRRNTRVLTVRVLPEAREPPELRAAAAAGHEHAGHCQPDRQPPRRCTAVRLAAQPHHGSRRGHGGHSCDTASRPIRKILTHLGEPLEPPPVFPARGPPADWGELVQVQDDRAIFQGRIDELPVIDIRSL